MSSTDTTTTTTTTTTSSKLDQKYDLILFGVTGFTGKLAAEYLLSSYSARSPTDENEKAPSQKTTIHWAACARNPEKAKSVLRDILRSSVVKQKKEEEEEAQEVVENEEGEDNNNNSIESALPPVLVADLQCSTPQEHDQLKQVVSQTRLVLTTAGPYSKYGTTLVQLCAELGVHYCDITGETNFVRNMIAQYDAVARSSGAVIICHCGNDCIPQDLMVYELNRYANEKLVMENKNKEGGGSGGGKRRAILKQVITYNEVADTAELSGGTVATALYNLGGEKGGASRNNESQANEVSFDPLLLTAQGEKSACSTKNITPKSSVHVTDLDKKASPWIMGPVMVNCVRRSNALLQYSENLDYADLLVESSDWTPWLKHQVHRALLGAALVVPSLQGLLLPSPGQGPSRQQMEAGHLLLHARATVVVMTPEDNTSSATTDQQPKQEQLVYLNGQFRFCKDVAYLYTAVLLVETGLLLLEKAEHVQGGVWTPASALGHDLTLRIQERLDASLEISQVLE